MQQLRPVDLLDLTHPDPGAVERTIALLERLGLADAADLHFLVHDAMNYQATDVNNSGLAVQAAWLVAVLGEAGAAAEIRSLIEQTGSDKTYRCRSER